MSEVPARPRADYSDSAIPLLSSIGQRTEEPDYHPQATIRSNLNNIDSLRQQCSVGKKTAPAKTGHVVVMANGGCDLDARTRRRSRTRPMWSPRLVVPTRQTVGST